MTLRGATIFLSVAVLGATIANAAPPRSQRHPAAAPPGIAELRAEFDNELKDMDSAKFKDVRIKGTAEYWTSCGTVNSKNSYGAYTGWKPFWVVFNKEKSGKPIILMDSVAAGMCGGNTDWLPGDFSDLLMKHPDR